ncbi:MAG: RNA polymerase sigma factor [Pyrinomonadaceae bacterium]
MSDATFQSEVSVELLRAHDEGAWQRLLAEARKRLEPYFEIIELGHLAEDLTSQTLVRLIRSEFINYESERSSILTWVVNTGKLIAREHLKKEVRRNKLRLEHEEMIAFNAQGDQERSGESELEKLANRALESLSENERTILLLRVVEGLSFELIAERLEISQNSARVRVTRARKKLRLEFERLLPRESRKRIFRSGPRNTGPSTSPPSSEKIQVTARW